MFVLIVCTCIYLYSVCRHDLLRLSFFYILPQLKRPCSALGFGCQQKHDFVLPRRRVVSALAAHS